MVLKKGRAKTDKREDKRKEEEEEEKRKEERRKGKRRSHVWNYEYLYVNYVCMELVKFRMEKCRFLYNSMDLSSFGIESIDIWFGILYFVYGLGLETPKLISC